MQNLTLSVVAKMIDHALLKPNLSETQIEEGIDLALRYDVASVCILPYYVARCAKLLAGSQVRVSTTIGFPHGCITHKTKLYEAKDALANGCEELDVVVNISRVLAEDWDYVRSELSDIVQVTHSGGMKIKVIFENCYLQDAHKIQLCKICSELGVDWVKTSTGFGPSGASLQDISLMRSHCPPAVQIKASGGIADLETLLSYRAAGVTRVGMSRTHEVMTELEKRIA